MKDWTEHPAVVSFVEAAEGYFSLLENDQGLTKRAFAGEILNSLRLLYSRAFDLPYPDLTLVWPSPRDETESWHLVYERLKVVFGEDDTYRLMRDPYVKGSIIEGSLAMDLAGTYARLKDGMINFRDGTDRGVAQAVCDWQTTVFLPPFRLVNAMRPLHELRPPLNTPTVRTARPPGR